MAASTIPTGGHGDPTRRDFLMVATGALGAVGVAAVAWPFINNLNPAADTLALSSIEVNVQPIQVGQAITVKWRGKPVFIRHRTPEDIKAAEMCRCRSCPIRRPTTARHRHRQEGAARVADHDRHPHHLGRVPLGNKPGQDKGPYDGWYCPCHGSAYDTSGRIRKGPAPKNLAILDYLFTSDLRPYRLIVSGRPPRASRMASSHGTPPVQQQGDRLDRSLACRSSRISRRSITPSRRPGISTTSGISARSRR